MVLIFSFKNHKVFLSNYVGMVMVQELEEILAHVTRDFTDKYHGWDVDYKV